MSRDTRDAFRVNRVGVFEDETVLLVQRREVGRRVRGGAVESQVPRAPADSSATITTLKSAAMPRELGDLTPRRGEPRTDFCASLRSPRAPPAAIARSRRARSRRSDAAPPSRPGATRSVRPRASPAPPRRDRPALSSACANSTGASAPAAMTAANATTCHGRHVVTDRVEQRAAGGAQHRDRQRRRQGARHRHVERRVGDDHRVRRPAPAPQTQHPIDQPERRADRDVVPVYAGIVQIDHGRSRPASDSVFASTSAAVRLSARTR